MAAIAHKYFPNGVLFKYAVYLCLHNLACNKCRLMRTHMRRSTSVAHLWLPGGSGYFPPDLLIFSRDDQAVPVHVEEIEDDTEGVFHPQPQVLLTKLLLISEGFSMIESILTTDGEAEKGICLLVHPKPIWISYSPPPPIFRRLDASYLKLKRESNAKFNHTTFSVCSPSRTCVPWPCDWHSNLSLSALQSWTRPP